MTEGHSNFDECGEAAQLDWQFWQFFPKEDGTIRRIYETNGIATYEVAVPQNRDSWTGGYYISDWAEGVLQLSNQ